MNILDKIKIAAGVELIPVKEINDLPEFAGLEFADDDYILNKRKSRLRSKVISADTAQLLRNFEEPSTIVDAILKYAAIANARPDELLTDVHPFVLELIQSGFLVFNWSDEDQPAFKIGDNFEEYTFTKLIHGLVADTQVYEAIADNGDLVVIKIGLEQPGHNQLKSLFDNETRILQTLPGSVNPKLLKAGISGGHPFLILERIENIPILEYARKLRDRSDITALVDLFKNILRAYESLHHAGVWHVDINPRNILIKPDGKVCIIDFGLASFASSPTNKLAGIEYFSPPELVRALSGGQQFQWGMYCEQYCIAALIYFLYTGKHYLNFSLETGLMHQQLLQDSPLPFSAQNAPAFTALEKILLKGLNKTAEDRFDNLSSFLSALELLDRPTAIFSTKLHYNLDDPAVYQDTDALLALLASPKTMHDYFTRAPSCSIFNGGAGIAYFLYRYALKTNNAETLSLADIWCGVSNAKSKEDTAFFNKPLGFGENEVEKISLFNSHPGVSFVQTLISAALGDSRTVAESIGDIFAVSNLATANNDLSMGRSGIILALAGILDSLPAFFDFDRQSIINYGDSYLNAIWHSHIESAINTDYRVKYTGIAHGWAGFIYAALRWYQATNAPVPQYIVKKIDEFYALREEHGQTIIWKSKINSRSFYYMPGWCNGGAGILELFTLAGKLLKSEKYLDIAKKISFDVCYNESLLGDLCCGLTGRAYSILSLYQASRDQHYYDLALQLEDRAKKATTFTKTDSLFKGKFGPKLLELEIIDPVLVRFPCL